MAVAVELLPVTGQTLPLISGGSSIWMTCFALGIIISVTKKDEEIVQELKDAAKEKKHFKLIDRAMEDEVEEVAVGNYSIEDKLVNQCKRF
jgi:cell division protein FtsW